MTTKTLKAAQTEFRALAEEFLTAGGRLSVGASAELQDLSIRLSPRVQGVAGEVREFLAAQRERMETSLDAMQPPNVGSQLARLAKVAYGEYATAVLSEVALRGNFRAKVIAITALSESVPASGSDYIATQVMVPLLKDEIGEVRSAAAYALCRWVSSPNVVLALGEALADSSTVVINSALIALEQCVDYPDPAVHEALRQVMRECPGRVRESLQPIVDRLQRK